MELLDLLEDDEPRPRLCVYAGYSFGLIKHARACGFQQYLSGLVVTPKWIERCIQELKMEEGEGPAMQVAADSDPLYTQEEAPSLAERIIIDNGAYPAWVKGEPLTLSEQLDGIHMAMEHVPGAEWIIAPDVVADARKTWARICACQLELETYGLDRLLLPVQEGMDIERVARLARSLQAGVFVGGATWRFKFEALKRLSVFDLRWVHVGRASTRHELEACARAGADAVDSSSFLRAQHHNVGKRSQYALALAEWAHDRGTPSREGHTPKLARWRKPTLAEKLSHRYVSARMHEVER